jgi:hypothetical protein
MSTPHKIPPGRMQHSKAQHAVCCRLPQAKEKQSSHSMLSLAQKHAAVCAEVTEHPQQFGSCRSLASHETNPKAVGAQLSWQKMQSNNGREGATHNSRAGARQAAAPCMHAQAKPGCGGVSAASTTRNTALSLAPASHQAFPPKSSMLSQSQVHTTRTSRLGSQQCTLSTKDRQTKQHKCCILHCELGVMHTTHPGNTPPATRKLQQ